MIGRSAPVEHAIPEVQGQETLLEHLRNWGRCPVSDFQKEASKLTVGYPQTLVSLRSVRDLFLAPCNLAAILRIRNRIYSRSIVRMG